jgi:Holliday junction resolvase-like predicted endonuclease
LSNPTFGEGMNKWDTENEATFFLLNNKWIWLNDNIYSKKGDFATVRKDAGRTVVFIRNKYISQTGANMKNIPEMITNSKGKKEPQSVYLSFFYRCQTAGTLNVSFENVNKTGFVDFDSIHISKNIDVTTGYKQFSGGGLWNGTGNFKLSFTGEIYLYMLVLSIDRIEALTYKYKTLFEQSEKLIKIATTSFDANGNPLQTSQIVTKSDMNLIATGIYDEDGIIRQGAGLITKSNVAALFAIGADGTLQSFVGASTDGVKIKASNITLEGLVTANQNFKILADGSIETLNAKISGEIYIADGKIRLNTDGSGQLANGNVLWDAAGNLSIIGDYSVSDANGNRIEISASDTTSIKIVNANNNIIGQWKFDTNSLGNSWSNLRVAAVLANGTENGHSVIGYDYIEVSDGTAYVSLNTMGVLGASVLFSDLPTSAHAVPGGLYKKQSGSEWMVMFCPNS